MSEFCFLLHPLLVAVLLEVTAQAQSQGVVRLVRVWTRRRALAIGEFVIAVLAHPPSEARAVGVEAWVIDLLLCLRSRRDCYFFDGLGVLERESDRPKLELLDLVLRLMDEVGLVLP